MAGEDIYVILVDGNDNPIGVSEKIKAHREALLHRAVSVFIINSGGDWILQKRALDKYHSRGLWTNACCTHPVHGEKNHETATRRLMEEMGIRCELREIFSFVYKEKLDNDLTEYELDHVFAGITDDQPVINTREVDEWKRIPFEELQEDIRLNPAAYTIWFRGIYQTVYECLLNPDTPKTLSSGSTGIRRNEQ